MGIKQDLQLSQCMAIEFSDGFDHERQVALPGHRLKGQVVIRNPKILFVGEIRATFYGISDAYIHRKIAGIRADLYGRGFLHQEIKTLTNGSPVSLEPNLDPGHRLPFEFNVPHSTSLMTQNKANFINRWQPKPSFAGAQEMHLLPPTCKFYKKATLGFTESSVSYRVDATCTKGKGGGSFWLPQASNTIAFSPTRSERDPDPGSQTVVSHYQIKSTAQAITIVLHVPSVCYAGGPFPLGMTRESSSMPVTLTSLRIQLHSTCLTRGRSFLFGEKESSETNNITIAATQPNLSIPIGPKPTDLLQAGLQLRIPQNVIPTFKSFTVSQLPYSVAISYIVRADDETIKGEVTSRSLDILPAFFQPKTE
ncbi:MAG: hypothetical protein Q9222_002987 [Ikaeria aurantiellina]